MAFEFFYQSTLLLRSLGSAGTCVISGYAMYVITEASTITELRKDQYLAMKDPPKYVKDYYDIFLDDSLSFENVFFMIVTVIELASFYLYSVMFSKRIKPGVDRETVMINDLQQSCCLFTMRIVWCVALGRLVSSRRQT